MKVIKDDTPRYRVESDIPWLKGVSFSTPEEALVQGEVFAIMKVLETAGVKIAGTSSFEIATVIQRVMSELVKIPGTVKPLNEPKLLTYTGKRRGRPRSKK